MAKQIGIFDKLIAAVFGGNISVDSILEYSQTYELDDLPDNGLVTKHILSEIVPPIPPGTIVASINKGDSYKLVIDWHAADLDDIYGLTPKLEVHIQYDDPDNPGSVCFIKATDLAPLEFRDGDVYNGSITEVHLYAHADPASPDPANPVANENTYLYISL